MGTEPRKPLRSRADRSCDILSYLSKLLKTLFAAGFRFEFAGYEFAPLYSSRPYALHPTRERQPEFARVRKGTTWLAGIFLSSIRRRTLVGLMPRR